VPPFPRGNPCRHPAAGATPQCPHKDGALPRRPRPASKPRRPGPPTPGGLDSDPASFRHRDNSCRHPAAGGHPPVPSQGWGSLPGAQASKQAATRIAHAEQPRPELGNASVTGVTHAVTRPLGPPPVPSQGWGLPGFRCASPPGVTMPSPGRRGEPPPTPSQGWNLLPEHPGWPSHRHLEVSQKRLRRGFSPEVTHAVTRPLRGHPPRPHKDGPLAGAPGRLPNCRLDWNRLDLDLVQLNPRSHRTPPHLPRSRLLSWPYRAYSDTLDNVDIRLILSRDLDCF
jgi:hypothetical protein